MVATDDKRIASVVREFGGHVVMTSQDCPNGTMRCHEAVVALEAEGAHRGRRLEHPGDGGRFVGQITQLADMLRKPNAAVVTLAKSMPADPEIQSPHRQSGPKPQGLRPNVQPQPLPRHGDGPWLQHVGLYGFTRTALEALVRGGPAA